MSGQCPQKVNYWILLSFFMREAHWGQSAALSSWNNSIGFHQNHANPLWLANTRVILSACVPPCRQRGSEADEWLSWPTAACDSVHCWHEDPLAQRNVKWIQSYIIKGGQAQRDFVIFGLSSTEQTQKLFSLGAYECWLPVTTVNVDLSPKLSVKPLRVDKNTASNFTLHL